MSRQASIEQLSEDDSASGSMRYRRRRAGCRMESQDSTASRDSISRYTLPNNCCLCNTSIELQLWSNKCSHQGGIEARVLNKCLTTLYLNMKHVCVS